MSSQTFGFLYIKYITHVGIVKKDICVRNNVLLKISLAIKFKITLTSEARASWEHFTF